MARNFIEISDDEDSDHHLSNEGEDSGEERKDCSDVVRDLFDAVTRNDAAAVQRALRNGADVNSSRSGLTPLLIACFHGHDDIVRILLNAGADARQTSCTIASAIEIACSNGRLPIVEILLNHDNGLLEIEEIGGYTSLLAAICNQQFEVVRFLLDRGANALATDADGRTTLLLACQARAYLDIVRRFLAAGVPLEARDEYQQTALHHAAMYGRIEVVRELIVEHNTNMFAVDKNGKTPFDLVSRSNSAGERHALFISCYGNKLTQMHGRLALHAVIRDAEYSFAARGFHPPQNPLRIRLPLGKLTLQQFRHLLSTLDAELIRNRDESGKLPIHIACRRKAPVEVLALIAEQDVATLQIADHKGALPIHSLCGSGSPTEYASVRFLVEQGGVGTLAARNLDGAMPLHVFCESSNPSLRTVQYLIQAFPESVTVQTNAGQYPFMFAARDTSEAPLSVVYGLIRANPSVL